MRNVRFEILLFSYNANRGVHPALQTQRADTCCVVNVRCEEGQHPPTQSDQGPVQSAHQGTVDQEACYLGQATSILMDRAIAHIFIRWWLKPYVPFL